MLLYKVQNNYVTPKLAHEERKLEHDWAHLKMHPWPE
jgi:hypothetical protein